MLYVRVELWPYGNKDRAEVLGEAYIANTGQGTPTTGEYVADIHGKGGKWLRSIALEGFPREKLLAWDLLFRVLDAGFGRRNADTTSRIAGRYLDGSALQSYGLRKRHPA